MFKHIKHKIDRPFVETAHTEEGHFYKTESGKTYPSITTVLKILDTKEWYPFWVAKVSRDEEINEIIHGVVIVLKDELNATLRA